jgi:uncharacterized membrane protein YfcA
MALTILIVGTLSVVQSLFGIGLLVFGTPSLLLLGYSFADTLAILLPASITISVLQVLSSHGQDRTFIRLFAGWCMLPLSLTLAAVLLMRLGADLNLVVALLLLGFVTLRLFPQLGRNTSRVLVGHERIWLLAMGIVHGLSNLGGGMLMIFAASREHRKEDIRALVAFCYACFAAMQLIVLAILMPQVFGWIQLGYVAIAGTTFLLVGQRVFRWVSAPVFDWLLTLFAVAYASLLGLRSAGII